MVQLCIQERPEDPRDFFAQRFARGGAWQQPLRGDAAAAAAGPEKPMSTVVSGGGGVVTFASPSSSAEGKEASSAAKVPAPPAAGKPGGARPIASGLASPPSNPGGISTAAVATTATEEAVSSAVKASLDWIQVALSRYFDGRGDLPAATAVPTTTALNDTDFLRLRIPRGAPPPPDFNSGGLCASRHVDIIRLVDRASAGGKGGETSPRLEEWGLRDHAASSPPPQPLAQHRKSVGDVTGLVARVLRASHLSPPQLLDEVARCVQSLVNADRYTVYRVDERRKRLAARINGKSYSFPFGRGIAGSVAATKTTTIVNSAYEDKRFDSSVDVKIDYVTRSVLTLPLVLDDKIVAVIQFINKLPPAAGGPQGSGGAPNVSAAGSSSSLATPTSGGDGGLLFDDADVGLVDTFLQLGKTILRNIFLYKEQRRLLQQQTKIAECNASLTRGKLHLSDTIPTIIKAAKSVVGADRCAVFLVPRDESLDYLIAHLEGVDNVLRVPKNKGIVGACLKSRQRINVAQAYTDPRFFSEMDAMLGYRTVSILCVPILNEHGKVVAIAQLLNKRNDAAADGALGSDDQHGDEVEEVVGFSIASPKARGDDDGGFVPFSDEDEGTLEKFAAVAANSMKQCDLHENIVARVHNQSILISATKALLRQDAWRDWLAACRCVGTKILDLCGAKHGIVFRVEDSLVSKTLQGYDLTPKRSPPSGTPPVACDDEDGIFGQPSVADNLASWDTDSKVPFIEVPFSNLSRLCCCIVSASPHLLSLSASSQEDNEEEYGRDVIRGATHVVIVPLKSSASPQSEVFGAIVAVGPSQDFVSQCRAETSRLQALSTSSNSAANGQTAAALPSSAASAAAAAGGGGLIVPGTVGRRDSAYSPPEDDDAFLTHGGFDRIPVVERETLSILVSLATFSLRASLWIDQAEAQGRQLERISEFQRSAMIQIAGSIMSPAHLVASSSVGDASEEESNLLPLDRPTTPMGTDVALYRALLANENLTKHAFDISVVMTDSSEEHRRKLTMYIMNRLFEIVGDLTVLNVHPGRLSRFLHAASERYRHVPYHNFTHACDVLQTITVMLSDHGGNLKSFFKPEERFALMVACVVHDIEHEGLNNAFHTKAKTAVGLVADAFGGGQGALELHHSRVAVELFNSTGLLKGVDPALSARIVFMTVSIIMATDMGRHKVFLDELHRTYDALSSPIGNSLMDRNSPRGQLSPTTTGPNSNSPPTAGAAAPRREEAEHRLLALKLLMKMADISNVAKPFEISRRWAIAVTEEFAHQTAKEQELNLPVTFEVAKGSAALAKSQIGFSRFLVRPFFQSAVKYFPTLNYLVSGCDDTIRQWEKVAESNLAFSVRTGGAVRPN